MNMRETALIRSIFPEKCINDGNTQYLQFSTNSSKFNYRTEKSKHLEHLD